MPVTDDNFFALMQNHFESLNIYRSQPLVMHCSLFDFFKVTNPVEKLWTFLNSYMHADVEMCFPTYCLTTETSYNPLLTKSSVGIFSQFIIDKSEGVRSLCPIHNHTFVRSKSINPYEFDYTRSFGVNTDFDYLYNNNYQLLLLGADFDQACTYIHHLEYLAAVPYREEKRFRKKIYDPGESKWIEIDFTYYARTSQSIITDFNKVSSQLQNLSSYRKSPITLCDSHRVSIKELHDRVLWLLSEDPSFLLK